MRKYQTLWFCMNLPLDLEQRCAVASGRTKFEAYISRRGGRNMAFFDELGKVISARCSAHPLGSGCDRFCSALCRSSRCDALPGGSRLLSVPGDSGADSYTSQSERGTLPGTYTHVKKAPGFIRLSLCTRRSAASASTDTGTDMPALSRMQNITTSL